MRALAHAGVTTPDRIKGALALGVILVATSFAGATQHAPALLLRVLVVVACVWLWPCEPARLRQRDCLAPVFAAAVVLVGLLLSPVSGFALRSVITVGLVCALYGALVLSPRDHWWAIAGIAAVVGTVHSLWAVAQWLGGETRGHGGFFNPNDLTAFTAPLAVVLLAHGLRRPVAGGPLTGGRRWVLFVAVASLAAGALASGSRSGLIALGVGATTVASGAVWRRPVLRPVIAGAAIVATAILVAIFWPRWSGREDPHAFARIDIWQRTAEVALAHPLGVGLGHYREAMRVAGVPLDGPVRYPKVPRHAHSEPLHAWAELGWPGLAATLLPAVMLLLALLRQRGRSDGPPGLDWAILASFAIPAAVSGSLHVPPVAFLATAWAAHVSRKDTVGGATIAAPRSRWWIALPTATLLVLALPGAVSAHAAEAAADRRRAGDLETAFTYARLSAVSAPWSLGAAMLVESLAFLLGKPPVLVSEDLVALADRFPYSPRPLTRAAWVLEQAAGDEDVLLWQAAAAIREQAVVRDPNNGVGWYELGVAQEASSRAADAETTWRHVLTVEPQMGRALARLAQRAHLRGEPAEARRWAEAAWAADRLGATERGYPASILSLGSDARGMLENLELGAR